MVSSLHFLIDVVLTDTLQGTDIPDIERVVQFGIPPSLSIWVQRAGRAGRDPSIQAEAIVVAEKTMHKTRKASAKEVDRALKDKCQEAENRGTNDDSAEEGEDEAGVGRGMMECFAVESKEERKGVSLVVEGDIIFPNVQTLRVIYNIHVQLIYIHPAFDSQIRQTSVYMQAIRLLTFFSCFAARVYHVHPTPSFPQMLHRLVSQA